MAFPILQQYKTQFPAHSALIDGFQTMYNKKLWYELSSDILKFIFLNDVKGKLSFNFYTDFVEKFQRNIDQISHLKILKQCLTNLSAQNAIAFLQNFQEKVAITDQNKAIAAGLRANYYPGINHEKSSELYHRLQKFFKERKDADTFAFSTFYRFALNYFLSKNKQKTYYQNALQFLAYTPGHQIQQKYKIELLSSMGIAILTSPEIYNFSELLEQPLLKTLQKSDFTWVYQLLVIFNQGDIKTLNGVIDQAAKRDKKLADNRRSLQQKIRLMAFLQMAFNLPKNNRTITFEELVKTCQTPLQHVQFMVMKAAALKLVRVQIDQISANVNIVWMAPKVLGNQRLQIMLNKFQQWETGVQDVEKMIQQNWKIKV